MLMHNTIFQGVIDMNGIVDVVVAARARPPASLSWGYPTPYPYNSFFVYILRWI